MTNSKKEQIVRTKRDDQLSLAGFKLRPSAKPPLFHGSTVRSTVTDFLWRKKVRPAILKQQGRRCSICGWIPKHESETRHLHLHEIEKYDFIHKVCRLIDIQLICRKCHSLQHIIRTELVSTKQQWEDVIQHFIKVNNCSPEIAEEFNAIAAKALHLEAQTWRLPRFSSIAEQADFNQKPVRFLISPHLPYAEELIKQVEKKGLLYKPELQE